MSSLKINKEDAVLVLIDFQERLMPAMKNSDELEASVFKLIKGCRILGVPSIVTQQYTKGLGPTVAHLHEALGDYEPVEKTAFSAAGEPAFMDQLEKTGLRTVLLAGIEAHVCVQQTALDLLEKGYKVYLIIDCIASRSNNDKKFAQRRMSEAGAVVTTCEAVLFELLGDAKKPGFKEISSLVK